MLMFDSVTSRMTSRDVAHNKSTLKCFGLSAAYVCDVKVIVERWSSL